MTPTRPFEHGYLGEAVTEAQRLANLHGREFSVFTQVVTVKPDAVSNDERPVVPTRAEACGLDAVRDAVLRQKAHLAEAGTRPARELTAVEAAERNGYWTGFRDGAAVAEATA